MPESSAGRMSAGDRRRQLLDAALELFSHKGYGGTTTKEIAAAAGVTEAIIFRHFPSKQALYTAVLDSKTEECEHQDWLTEIQALMERQDDAGVMRRLSSKILEAYRTDGRIERILLFSALEGHELGLAHYRRFAIPVFELLRDYIVRRQKAGALRGYDAGAVIVAMAGMAQNYAIYTEFFGFKPLQLGDEEIIGIFTDIMMSGIQLKAKAAQKASSKKRTKK